MLFIFRKLRQIELRQRSGRYLLYAFGEIILIVVGIMIALQISNWNEFQKERVKERKVLQEVVRTLDLNTDLLGGYVDLMIQSNESARMILEVIEKQLPYTESIAEDMHKARYQMSLDFVSHAGFEELKNAGLDIVQSDDLRRRIVNLFENTYPLAQQQVQLFHPMDHNIRKYVDENFKWILAEPPAVDQLIPFNYDQVIQDPYYRAIVVRLFDERDWFRTNYQQCIDQTEIVKAAIEAM